MRALAVVAVIAGCSGDKPAHPPEANPWLEDLHALAAELPARHVEPWFHTREAAWRAEVTRLEAAIPSQTEAQTLVGLAHLVAMIGDAHTRLHLTAHSYPVLTYEFADGLYVTGARDSWAIGAKVVGIGGKPLAEARTLLASVIPAENESGLRGELPGFAAQPTVLAGLGLAADDTHVTYQLELPDGSHRDLTVESSLLAVSPKPPATIPLYLESGRARYWLKTQPGLVYVKYNQCAPGDPPLPAFFHQILAAVDADPAAKVVVDVRNNGGGNSSLFDPLIFELAERRLKGRLYCVIGRETFSSALLNAISLARAGATLVGEPTAAPPSHHGEVKSFTLPRSKLVVSYSTKYFEDPDHKGDSLRPDIPAQLTYADWAAGRDPVLDAIVRR